MMRPVGQTTDAEAPILLASKAKPTSMSSGIATVMKDQTSDRLKQNYTKLNLASPLDTSTILNAKKCVKSYVDSLHINTYSTSLHTVFCTPARIQKMVVAKDMFLKILRIGFADIRSQLPQRMI
jgi:hypothetical protein